VLAGDWRGAVTTPWTQPYSVLASFGADGSYSARCVENSDVDGGGCCRAFYYGSDRNSALKRWSLTQASPDGSVSGSIDIAFCYDGEPCYAPAWQGELRRLERDATGNRLAFEFWRNDGYGPVRFDLERAASH
jgi:hypothetical protein